MNETNVLEVLNVSKKAGARTLVDHVSFSIQAGDVCGFVGPNGAGKTTLIRMMTGLIKPGGGSIRIDGTDVGRERVKALSRVGAIVESPIFFPYMSGRDNLLNLARLHPNVPGTERKARVEEALSIVGLSERGSDKVKTYSLGMKQRLGIAQALLGDPRLIILDEPANGLDPMGIRELRQLIQRLNQERGITFLVSSHLLDELQRICSRFVIIKEGKLVWEGTSREWQEAAGAKGIEEHFVEMMTS
ncbi:ABC transporter ATP-binding protein [Paenibacillus sp. SSG-1]|uniref:ABC transporter ATP-binding protein n=1 Tax=unclassified Paenibacillus TaxID=185978 RepID=UPI000B7E1F08|nr:MULTISPECIES: ABC transporter ATP-binding protein [unclassified Paenibacillus]OXL87733.1 ABC transporter ATP-binding protein [Paenibacillus sp. SSG-1]PQP90178.1 ABC transporter ATP-binding protein [Paenibacillus sp. AR247]